ncbi:MAG TPA: tyrosine-type recombinase/integrase [Microlunatus sp.]|nr:tyrosine-type recombinase/integrase [Microlunatus sp.]
MSFTEKNLVLNAGLLPAALAQRVGLGDLVDQRLRLAGEGANSGSKALTVIGSMLVGGDSIDDTAVLRAGAAGSLFDDTRAPSTVGSWLRAHKWSNVRELDAVSRQLLARLWAAGAGPGDLSGPLTIDLDSSIVPVYGRARQGAAFGYTKVRGYHPQSPLVDKVLGRIKKDVGAPTVKSCRSVVSSVMNLAVRYGAVTINPVREVERIEARAKKTPRALSESDIADWLGRLSADRTAQRRDLPDLSLFMIATGVRIGEALAVVWNQVDLDGGHVEITHTIIRVKGQGLVRKPTKSSAGERLLGLPLTLVAVLRRRFAADGRLDLPVFPDALGGFRDPANTRRGIRDARGEDALAWITSHNFRKTMATMLDSDEFTAREIADQLGHARPSMTQDVYMGRRIRNPRAVQSIEAALRRAAESEKHG